VVVAGGGIISIIFTCEYSYKNGILPPMLTMNQLQKQFQKLVDFGMNLVKTRPWLIAIGIIMILILNGAFGIHIYEGMESMEDGEEMVTEDVDGEIADPSSYDTTYSVVDSTPPSDPTDPMMGMGIPKSQIPPGQQDLYIRKSQIVPPVCPKCPSIARSSSDPAPPCPACARCPKPAFDCKKVPNYQAGGGGMGNMPVPVLNDFSTFGM
jgi:hypothetical protein